MHTSRKRFVKKKGFRSDAPRREGNGRRGGPYRPTASRVTRDAAAAIRGILPPSTIKKFVFFRHFCILPPEKSYFYIP
jgi:hypothetical protein